MGKKSEPQITKCKQGENWTRVTFKPDLAKFNMTHLENDVVALMRKRVVDMAGTLGKTVKVELDHQKVPVHSFSDYVKLYIKSASKDRDDVNELPRFDSSFLQRKIIFGCPCSYIVYFFPLSHVFHFSISQKVNDRWEVCVSLSEGQFQQVRYAPRVPCRICFHTCTLHFFFVIQVSFVNRIATIKGGTHVDYVTNQIATHVMNIVNKRNKNVHMKAHNVKSHLWVFVNALIDNPAFDSQTKETLTTRQASFGSKCELSDDFLKKGMRSIYCS